MVDLNNPVNFEPRINGIRTPLIRAGDTLNLKAQPVDPEFDVLALQVINPLSGAADSDAVLIYNDYDVAWENAKSDAMYELLKRELEAGTAIDGVGFQMHLRSEFNDFDSVERNLQRFADLGLQIYITEFDVALDAPDTEEQQAVIYQRSLEICLALPACKAMQAWGYTDRYS